MMISRWPQKMDIRRLGNSTKDDPGPVSYGITQSIPPPREKLRLAIVTHNEPMSDQQHKDITDQISNGYRSSIYRKEPTVERKDPILTVRQGFDLYKTWEMPRIC